MRLMRPLRSRQHDQLYELYRAAEQGSHARVEAGALTLQEFEADQTMIAELRNLAAQSERSDSHQERAQLLALVAQRRSQAAKEARPAMKRLVQRRAIALAGATVLLAGTAAGVGAAGGGVSDVAGNVGDVLTALHVTDRTPDVADGHIDAIEQRGGPDGEVDAAGLAGGSENANDNAQHGLDQAAEQGDNAGDGIQNASPTGRDHADDHALDGPDASEPEGADTQSADPPDVNLPDQADGEASEGAANAPDEADNGGVELPSDADGHAADGGGNAQIPDNVPDDVHLPLP